MESYTDDRILGQPIGYWASMTGRSAVTFIRATLERHGLTQPQWWALNYIADRPAGVGTTPGTGAGGLGSGEPTSGPGTTPGRGGLG